MKRRIRVNDRVEIAEGRHWPWGHYGVVVRKDPVVSGKVVTRHWYVVLQDGAPEPRLFTRSQIEVVR